MRIAIIGTREPSEYQVEAARSVTRIALYNGHEIATGAAMGIDNVAMQTCVEEDKTDSLFLYLPWKTYNKELIPDGANITVYRGQENWKDSVKKFHPNYSALSQGTFKLHARNYGIIANSNIVVAFPKKNRLGGTGQGIRIARELGIDCFVLDEIIPSRLIELIEHT